MTKSAWDFLKNIKSTRFSDMT